ncbi:MAG TPA: trigger factor [Candidatus Saccharimonadales bacterium]|nr:trigger factor [Candidatus Saccharimonadales bacterium]
MSTTKKQLSPTKVQLKLTANDLSSYKEAALRKLGTNVKVQGFRPGKAPSNLIEKQLNPNLLQSEVLDQAINSLYGQALREHRLRPASEPKVSITKFVPFENLEADVEVEVIGEVTLADYKKIKVARKDEKVTAKEIDEVLEQLATRQAEKKDVERAAKNSDEVWIDFKGVDAKTKEAIKGADGQDYPLLLGSNTFIPGFETNLVGAKPGDEKEFTLTFPKDYGVAALQNRKVTFTVTVKKVQEVASPKIDDAFAAKVGPFKSLADLKTDIDKELKARKQTDAEQAFTNELIRTLAEKSKVAIPDGLVDEQLDRIEREQRQNLTYRGQTWQEYLESEKLTEETFRKKHRADAELRVKAGIVLAEVAEAEKITVTPEEFNSQLQVLKARYPDAQMQAQLEKPENQRDILSRMVTDKTVAKLKEYAK